MAALATPARFGADIAIRDVSMRFASGLNALDAVTLTVGSGEFLSVVGPSGCGKSTLLRIIAGLTRPSTGTCTGSAGSESAFVFQEAALLPWRNVQRNAELLMELEGIPIAERRARVAHALELVGLAGFEQSFPHRLSGGMRMRLSLARAIALRPRLLLLDEPLAAVDELTRDLLQEELASMWQAEGFTAVLVTHNVQEAIFLSNRVVVMSPRPGRVLSIIDVPFTFPRAPQLRSSAEFAQLAGIVSTELRAHG